MTVAEARKYISMYFEFNTEARSIWQEVTDNGVFTHKDVEQFDDETIVTVAEDLKMQIHQELGL